MEDRYVYILNLTRYRIFLFSVALVILFSSVFGLGLFMGVYSSSYKLANLTENEIRELATQDIYTETYDTLAGESPAAIARDNQSQSRIISSADLLAQDIKRNKLINNNKTHQPTAKHPPKKLINSIQKPPPHSRQNTRIAPTGYQTKYFIQLVVSQDKKRTKKLLEQLLSKELKAYIRSNIINGKVFYAVRVGLYTDKKKAIKHLQQLKKTFKDAYIKVNVPRKS